LLWLSFRNQYTAVDLTPPRVTSHGRSHAFTCSASEGSTTTVY
jgi:hypothetical protein